MEILELILEILIILVSLVIIIAVALQKSKSEGITGVTATSESDNYFGQNKELGSAEKLSKITKVALIIFVVISLLITVLFSVDAAISEQKKSESSSTEAAIVLEDYNF